MNNGKQIVTRCIAILMLCGIVFLSGYGLYQCIADFDKPVVAESNSIDNSFEISDSIDNSFELDGQKFFVRHDGIYDEFGNLTIGIVEEDENISRNTQYSSSLRDILYEAFEGEREYTGDFSIFGCGKEDIQRLYIQSVINSMTFGRTIEVSRWVTSGDWSHDNDEMIITIP